MTRAQLEHIIRAAASISEDDEIIIVGSQAILGQFPAAPAALLISIEADVFPKHHVDRADLIDGSIGEGSPFHRTFGYYAQGVGPDTATLPTGWEQRLVPIRSPSTRDATGWCLEVHDLMISKYVAGREKDRAFTKSAARHGLTQKGTLLERLAATAVYPKLRRVTEEAIERDFRASALS